MGIPDRPIKLALDSLAKYHNIPPDEAEAVVRLSVDKLVNSAFMRLDTAGDTFQVHSLVARTVRYHEDLPEFQQHLREMAVAALTPKLSGSVDIRQHTELAPYVIHAKHLAEMPANEREAELSAWIVHYEYNRGAYSQARQLNERVIEVRRRTLGEEHPDTLTSMHNLAATLYEQGDLAGARQLHKLVLEGRRRILGEEHTDTLSSMNYLARMLRAEGDLEGAHKLLERALEGCRRILGEDLPGKLNLDEDFPGKLSIANSIAELGRAQGDLAGARQLHGRLLEFCRQKLGEEHPFTLSSMNNLAETIRAQGDFAGARQLHEQVLKVRRRVPGEEHPSTLLSMNNLAETFRAEGNLAEARKLQERVLEVRRRKLGEMHTSTTVSAWNLYNTLVKLHGAESADVFQRSLSWLLQAEPESLSNEQTRIREGLFVDIDKKSVAPKSLWTRIRTFLKS